MLLDANRDSRVMLRVADTGLLGLARGTMWIVSWKSGLTTDIRGPPCLATRSPRTLRSHILFKDIRIWNN